MFTTVTDDGISDATIETPKKAEMSRQKGVREVDRVIPRWAYFLYPYILDKDFGFGRLTLEVA